MKKLSLSIGIAAYNEENNITQVILDILSQNRRSWNLKEISVYCDGCTDNTYEKTRNLKNKYIKVFDGKLRRGKTYRLQQMFKNFDADILVMFDADIMLSNKEVINNLITSFINNRNIMLIGGNSMPYPPKTFFEKAVYASFSVFYKSRKNIHGGHNVFGCTGSILAIRKELAKITKFPKIINEDAYLYMLCLTKGFIFRYVDNAVIYYKLPKNPKDYIKQIIRSEPRNITIELKEYFGDLVGKEFSRPLKFYFRAITKEFLLNPIGVIIIILINLSCRLFISTLFKKYDLKWFTAESTK